MTAAASSDSSVAGSAGRVLPQLRLKRPSPARGVLSPPRATQPPQPVNRLTRLSDAAAGFPCVRLVESFLYFWTVVASMLGIVLACLVLYLMYFKDGGNLAPVLPFCLAAYGALAITVASACGLYGLLHHRRIVTEGGRNYSLGIFVFLGVAGAVVVVVAGAMALSLAHVVQLAQDEDFSSDRVAVLETKVISKLHEQVTKSSSAWREMQNELKCCGYDQTRTIQTYLSATSSWNSSLLSELEDVNAVAGRYCSTRTADCLRTTSEAHCPVSGRDWCRLELLQVAHDNYSLLSTCAITFGAFQLLFSLLGVFTLLCDVRRISGSSPIYEIQHRMLSPVQPSAPQMPRTRGDAERSEKRRPMARATAKASSSPTARHKPPPAASAAPKTQETSLASPVVVPPVQSEPRPATPVTRTRKRVVRRPKYHETTPFLERESFKGLASTDPSPNTAWFPASTLGESYRVASTLFRAAQRASLETRSVSWGYGYTDGALGHHNTRRVVEMKRLATFRRAIVRAVSAGDRLSLFLTDDNRILQSGRLFMKQDGCKMWKPVEITMKSVDVTSTGASIVAVEAGHLAAYALDDQGRVYSWGTQIFGQLGHGEELEQVSSLNGAVIESESDATLEGEDSTGKQGEDNSNSEEEELEGGELEPKVVIVEKVPRLVEGLAGLSILKISAGNHFVVAISTTGAVFTWGRGCFGQLGNGEASDVSTPALVEALKDYVAVDVAAGSSHVLGVFLPRDERSPSNQVDPPPPAQTNAATERTAVMTWGRGKHGCLGLGGSNNELLPCENAFFRGLGATKVAAGADHSLVLCCVGAHTFLYAFGGNELGQLGVASSADHVDMPSFLDEFVNVHVADIGAGAQYSAALTGDGEVFTWGDARYGKTSRADGRTTFVPWPVDLPRAIPSSSFVTQISIGAHHALAQLRISGEVDRWRKFPLDCIDSAVCLEEQSSKVSLCYCKSSQTTTRSVLGIFVQCATCRVSPLCRVCCRRCHAGHVLKPAAVGRSVQRACVCSSERAKAGASCLFTTRLPFVIPEEAETTPVRRIKQQ